ncbi:MAG: hypothetical protein AB7P37_18905 [Ramlibacter sp.]
MDSKGKPAGEAGEPVQVSSGFSSWMKSAMHLFNQSKWLALTLTAKLVDASTTPDSGGGELVNVSFTPTSTPTWSDALLPLEEQPTEFNAKELISRLAKYGSITEFVGAGTVVVAGGSAATVEDDHCVSGKEILGGLAQIGESNKTFTVHQFVPSQTDAPFEQYCKLDNKSASVLSTAFQHLPHLTVDSYFDIRPFDIRSLQYILHRMILITPTHGNVENFVAAAHEVDGLSTCMLSRSDGQGMMIAVMPDTPKVKAVLEEIARKKMDPSGESWFEVGNALLAYFVGGGAMLCFACVRAFRDRELPAPAQPGPQADPQALLELAQFVDDGGSDDDEGLDQIEGQPDVPVNLDVELGNENPEGQVAVLEPELELREPDQPEDHGTPEPGEDAPLLS